MLKIDLVICFINVTYKACLITIIMLTNLTLFTGISVGNRRNRWEISLESLPV